MLDSHTKSFQLHCNNLKLMSQNLWFSWLVNYQIFYYFEHGIPFRVCADMHLCTNDFRTELILTNRNIRHNLHVMCCTILINELKGLQSHIWSQLELFLTKAVINKIYFLRHMFILYRICKYFQYTSIQRIAVHCDLH